MCRFPAQIGSSLLSCLLLHAVSRVYIVWEWILGHVHEERDPMVRLARININDLSRAYLRLLRSSMNFSEYRMRSKARVKSPISSLAC